MNGRCDDCPHLYCEDPEFRDGPAVWKCGSKNGCMKEKEEKE